MTRIAYSVVWARSTRRSSSCHPTPQGPLHPPGQQRTCDDQIHGQHVDRYVDLAQERAFTFGDGLSYSTVEEGEFELRVGGSSRASALRAVRFTVGA